VAPNPPAGVTPAPAANSSANGTNPDAGWLDARATWYGAPTGAGPDDDGGACGFKNVSLPPFSAMTSCGNEPLFKDGKGCGSCYQVRPSINQSMHSPYYVPTSQISSSNSCPLLVTSMQSELYFPCRFHSL
jgi:hypothetical protein